MMFEKTIWNMLQIKTYDTRFDVRALAAYFCFFSFKSIRYSRYSSIHFCTFSLACPSAVVVCYLCHSIDYYYYKYFFAKLLLFSLLFVGRFYWRMNLRRARTEPIKCQLRKFTRSDAVTFSFIERER